MAEETDTQTESYELKGVKAKFGTRKLTSVILQSADLNLAFDNKEVRNHVGAVKTMAIYNKRVEASISAKCLADTSYEAVEAELSAWLAEVAVAAPFSLPAGGTVVVTEFKVAESNEDFADLSVSATYNPDMNDNG